MNTQETGTPTKSEDNLSDIREFGSATENLFQRIHRALRSRAYLIGENQRLDQQSQIRFKHNELLKQLIQERNTEIDRLNGILSSINEGVIMQSLDGRIILINDAAQRLLGSQKNFWESALGTLFTAYQDIDQIDGELTILGQTERIELNDQVLCAQLAAIADRNGERLGTIIILQDITDEASVERLQKDFINQISHELRTPMTSIKLASEVLLGTPEDQPSNRKILDTLERNVDSLDRMIVELIDISKMNSGMLELEHETIDLEELVWTARGNLTPDIFKAKLELIVLKQNADEIKVKGDRRYLLWAIEHVLRNSIVYNVRGGKVIVKLGMFQSPDENWATLQIRDTGVGISDDDLPHIFEQFYRGNARDAEGNELSVRGLGQGLFIARHIIDALQGEIHVQSAQFRGSTFTISLPAVETDV